VDRGSNSDRDWRRFVGDCEAAIGDGRLDALAGELDVSAESLRRLRVGWSGEHGAWTFPMFDAEGQVLGVRLRGRDGRKWAVRGGREGLFIARFDDGSAGGGDAPAHAAGEENSPALVVCEGPTDAAALIDLGFRVVGRPSCSGGVRLIVDLVQRPRPGDVAILADGDPPGLRGAFNLASVLAVYVPCVRVATPPDGVKDARAWKIAGATHDDVRRRIAAAEPRRLGVAVKGVAAKGGAR
jgi:hypothetical protein